MKINLLKINAWFEKASKRIIKYRWMNLGIFLVVIMVFAYGASLIRVDVSNENSFLPNDPINRDTDEFKEVFGNDQYVGILVESEDLFSHGSLTLIRELTGELKDSIPFIDRVTSLDNIEYTVGTEYGMYIESIVPDVIPEDVDGLQEIRQKAFAKDNFRKRLVSADGRQSWIVVKLLPFPKDWQDKFDTYPQLMVGEAVARIIADERYTDLHPRAVGMPYLSYEKREFFERESARVMGLALLMAVIVLAIALRSIKGVIIPLVTAVSAIIIVNGIIGFSGIAIDNMVMSFPVLIGLAVALAYSIHIYSFYKREFLRTGRRRRAVVHSIGEMGWPVFFTAVTTICALLSFVFIPIKTVRFIGLTTAAVVGVTYLVIIILTPALLSFGKNRQPHPAFEKNGRTRLENKLEQLSEWILRHPRGILVCYAAISLLLVLGTTRVKADTDPRKNIGLKIPYVNNLFEVCQTELGSLYSYDLSITFDEPGMAKEPEVLANLDRLATEVEQYPLTKRTNSVVAVIKDMNQVMYEDDPAYYALPDSREMIAQLFLLYENAGGTEAEYWVDYDYQRLRLQVELDDFAAGEARKEYNMVTVRAGELFPGARIAVVGTMPQFMKMIAYVTRGQIISFMIAFVIIAGIMMLVFGNVKTGLIGLIPNITPALVIGGLMGFLDIPLDSSTVIIMPMILGLAVDDTIHFINHAKLEFLRTGRYRISLKRTFSTVGVALLFTTIILSANFLTYMTSIVKFYFNMGLLAVAGMASALLADYLVTPVLFRMFRIFGEEKDSPSITADPLTRSRKIAMN
jgi:predicted RND superfamily exporter protein